MKVFLSLIALVCSSQAFAAPVTPPFSDANVTRQYQFCKTFLAQTATEREKNIAGSRALGSPLRSAITGENLSASETVRRCRIQTRDGLATRLKNEHKYAAWYRSRGKVARQSADEPLAFSGPDVCVATNAQGGCMAYSGHGRNAVCVATNGQGGCIQWN